MKWFIFYFSIGVCHSVIIT